MEWTEYEDKCEGFAAYFERKCWIVMERKPRNAILLESQMLVYHVHDGIYSKDPATLCSV